MVDPIQALNNSQKQLRALLGGVPDPAEALRSTVDMVSALGDLAASTAVPLQNLLASQRNLANAMQSFADLQQELGQVVGQIAASHNAVLDALEGLAWPITKASEVVAPAARKVTGKGAAAKKSAPKKAAPKKAAPKK